ncbi:MAG TPA: DUF998 domain-containing protein [Gammaproteobacteria bacterium]|nr:DUF998 domain-containing protein [Gammaproteobacteria bacterium]
MKSSATLPGVIVALIAIAVGPYFTAPGYSSVTHAISELGAQGAPNSWIMNAGFFAYGLGVLIDAVRRLRTSPFVAVAFMVFGLAMIMNAVFSHRPIDHELLYDVRADTLHSLFATVVGFSFTFGALAQSFIERYRWRRLCCYAAAAAAVILPLGMLQFPGIQGVLQRLMFGISFAWLVVFLPK